VLGSGAALRAVAVLCRAGVDRSLLPAVADASPAHQGRMPATDIPVIAPAEVAAGRPDAVVLSLSDLLPEMRAMLPDVEAAGARWVDARRWARRPACERRSVSAIAQLCFSTASTRLVTLAPRDDELGRHCGFSLSAVKHAPPWLQRAVGRHSPVERRCHRRAVPGLRRRAAAYLRGIPTGLEFHHCQWWSRQRVGQLRSFQAVRTRPPRTARSSAIQSPEAARGRGRCTTGVSGGLSPSWLSENAQWRFSRALVPRSKVIVHPHEGEEPEYG
jgi:hypothetical protein